MKDRRLWLLLAVALAVRLVLMPLPDPYDADLTTFWLPWMAYGVEHGLAQLYLQGQPPVNYPPLFLTLLLALGKLYRLISPDMAYGPVQSALIKLPAVAADLVIAALLYRAASQIVQDEREIAPSPSMQRGRQQSSPEASDVESTSPQTARTIGSIPLLAAALWALNPATFYVSAYWAQVDAIHTLWMLVALLAAVAGRWGCSGLFMALALLTKLQAAAVLPLILVLALCYSWRAVAWTLFGLFGTLALGLAPFALDGTLGAVRAVYLGAVGFYPALTVNAYNFWFLVQFAGLQLLDRLLLDTTRILGPVTLRWVGLVLIAGYTALILWMLWRGRLASSARSGQQRYSLGRAWLTPEQRTVVLFAAGMLVFGFFSLATEMHERYALPALAFLAIPAAQDRRVLLPYLLLTGSICLNLVRVLPWGPGIFRLIQSIPGDRVLASLVSLALFAWLTVLYLQAAGRLAHKKEEHNGMATVPDRLQ